MMFVLASVCALGFTSDLYVPGYQLGPPYDVHSLYRIDTEALEAECVWHGDKFVSCAKRSPTTALIAFIGSRLPGPGVVAVENLFVVSDKGMRLHEVENASTSFSWSPDGMKLVYCPLDMRAGKPNGEMWILHMNTGQKEKIPEVGYKAYWSKQTGDILFSRDRIHKWNPQTRETAATSIPSLEFAPQERFLLLDCGKSFEVYRVYDFDTSPGKLAAFGGRLNEVPNWLSGQLLRTYLDDPSTPIWYVFDSERCLLYESTDIVVAADEENNLVLVKAGQLVRRKLEDLEQAPLDRLQIERY